MKDICSSVNSDSRDYIRGTNFILKRRQGEKNKVEYRSASRFLRFEYTTITMELLEKLFHFYRFGMYLVRKTDSATHLRDVIIHAQKLLIKSLEGRIAYCVSPWVFTIRAAFPPQLMLIERNVSIPAICLTVPHVFPRENVRARDVPAICVF